MAVLTVVPTRPSRLMNPFALVGILGFLASFVGSWIPSLWYDEIATISAAHRSIGELWALVQRVDAVHWLYYSFMHFWISFFGSSELSLRLPSALAAGLACVGTVHIGRKLATSFVGVAAGVVLAVMPRMIWAGSEARQYAFTALVAVILTLLLIRAWENNRRSDWLAYVAVALVGILLFMFFALIVGAHLVAALILKRRVAPTILSAAAVAIASSPFVLFLSAQKAQVAWIEGKSIVQYLSAASLRQFFYGDDQFRDPAPGWIMAFAAVLTVIQLGLAVLGCIDAARTRRYGSLLVLSGCIVIVPIATLFALSVTVQPFYVQRYLTFTSPGMALLAAVGMEKIRAWRPSALPFVVTATLVASLVPQLTLKSLINEPADSTRGIAMTVADKVTSPAGIVYQSDEQRVASIAYPDAFKNLNDLSIQGNLDQSGTMWGRQRQVKAADLAGHGRVWFLGSGADASHELAPFDQAGCRRTDSVESKRLLLVAYDCF